VKARAIHKKVPFDRAPGARADFRDVPAFRILLEGLEDIIDMLQIRATRSDFLQPRGEFQGIEMA
jgi:hypothetical protein